MSYTSTNRTLIKRLVFCDKRYFFLNLRFTQFDCESKEGREGRGIFFAKEGMGGLVEKGVL